MDDLLALMEDDEPQELEQSSAPRRHEEAQRSTKPASAKVTPPTGKRPNRPTPPTRQSVPPLSRAEAGVDAKLGIRMLNRKIGSIDLLDLMSSNPYYSPASLVAMTTASLNNLLQDPAAVIDVATVTGRTSLLTIGIVFTNSGTKISKSGRAFSILEIGNFATGPIVTVFLFGDAYSRNCKICVPGTVIALLNPSIVPPKENNSSKGNSNSLSLSVGDQRQLLPVAKARDYGICKGVSKSKRPDGRLTEHSCKNHVDTRQGHFCRKHSKQANAKHGKTAKDQTFLQKTRQELPKQPTMAELLNGNRQMVMPGNQLLQTKTNPLLSKAPRKMVKGQAPQGQSKIATLPNRNPYRKQQILTKPVPTAAAQQKPIQMGFAGQWLNGKSAGTAIAKKRKVNLDGCGFDGNVMVPKANKLFRSSAPVQPQRASATESAEDRERAIRERQSSLSRAFQEMTNSGNASQPHKKKLLVKKTKKHPASSSTGFFADLPDIDVAKVMNAKSRFETEVKAEEYARKRRAVVELEKNENRQQKKEAKKKSNKPTSKVQREWHCVDCKRTFGVDPKMCKRMGHRVKLKRSIEEQKTVTEKRLQLDDKAVEDGGMKLGAGVEWTRYFNY